MSDVVITGFGTTTPLGPDAPTTWQGLLDHGVLVRDVGIPGHLRVTAGTEAETTAFLTALRQVLGR